MKHGRTPPARRLARAAARPTEAALPTPPRPTRDADARRADRSIVIVSMVLLIVVFGLLVWTIADVLLLVFAGILIGVFLRGLGDGVSALTGLSRRVSFGVVLATLAALLIVGGALLGNEMASQLEQLGPSLHLAWEKMLNGVYGYEWGRILFSERNLSAMLPEDGTWLTRLGGAFSMTIGAIAGLLIAVFIGLYGAAAPAVYRHGLLLLVPAHARSRAREVLDTVTMTMRWWLIGTFARMAVVGLSVTVGLWLLDIQLALALGLIAFVLDFVPYIGPILAALPALLVAIATGPADAFYVLLLYLAVQMAENYVVTPLIDQYSVHLPPALTISAQVLLGALLGALGVVFATPLTAIALVLVRMLYVEEDLESSAGTEAPPPSPLPPPATGPPRG
ncbi:AI-2E family transporter [Aromatoleum bremense]|uniref:AI-2E family transporter n=1 Tax=Aromatoleum bremense TaxID=76115 RepID=A0ABX1NYH7_9RHOO|nr:AI-2E family transporter [Aromatoleum bremense]NMG17095.1 AI-2E family transporter [Aromatoleum bremense]QTQ33429.1 Transmembrane protein TqsA-like family protein [Aromatoleum bremense]